MWPKENYQQRQRWNYFVLLWTVSTSLTGDPMNCNTPGFPVFHCLPEFAQTYVHWVSDAIQPSHSPLTPSLPALNLPQHQDLFQWVSSSYQVAKGFSILQSQHQPWFPQDWLVWSPCSPRDSQDCSPTPQFKSINSLVLSFLYVPTLTSIHDYWKNHRFD